MAEPQAELDEALERVIAAARGHLAAVRAAEGALDDEGVWASYVALNNASAAYGQLLMETYGETTPWQTEEIPVGYAAEAPAGTPEEPASPADPYPAVISVRQRRDFRVRSISGLLTEAATASARLDEAVPVPETVGEAVLGLVQSGDGSLAALDVPVLEPLQGVVTVTEVARPLDLVADSDDLADLFRADAGDQLVARLDEYPYVALDEDEDEPIDPADGPGRPGGPAEDPVQPPE